MRAKRAIAALAVLPLFAAACGNTSDSGSNPTTTEAAAAATTTAAAATTDTSGGVSSDQIISAVIEAPGGASILIDGDPSDWADIPGVDVTLKPITNEPSLPHDAVVKVAHDDTNAYVLFQVNDDLNYSTVTPHLSGAAAVEWAIEGGAGEAMGSLDADRQTSLGMVDIWHWELECNSGIQSGGAVAGPGDGTGGNDSGCNFDDEYATQTDVREDDDTSSAENSLLGVWGHSATVEDGEGNWYFEMMRPLNTGDEQDAVFTPGESSLMNVAYWDPDRADGADEGWDDDYHVVTAMDGWMQVNWGTESGGGVEQASPAVGASDFSDQTISHEIDAPGGVSITVDGDDSDWADVPGTDVRLRPITNEPSVPHNAVVKFAHDDTTAYVLFQVNDDRNWSDVTPHLSGAAAVEWAIDPAAGEAMGSLDPDRQTSLGMVDIWHWELECDTGIVAGGTQAGPGDGTGGNDSACNFDDEYASQTDVREDDDTASAENSLTGVWTHSATVEDGEGTWTFEMSRPMNTGDEQDAVFTSGSSSLANVAYWDPDRPDGASEGWDDDYHVVTAMDGWMQINWG